MVNQNNLSNADFFLESSSTLFYAIFARFVQNFQRQEAELRRMKRQERLFELAIREAFLRFMATIWHNYKSFLRTNTRKPGTKAIDRNLAKFFDTEGFVRSKEAACQPFYRELCSTQLFYDCIMNLSFASELEPTLADAFAFFAELCSRINPAANTADEPMSHMRVIEMLGYQRTVSDQTVVVMAPCMSDYAGDNDADDGGDDVEAEYSLENSAFVYEPNVSHFPRVACEMSPAQAAALASHASSSLVVARQRNSPPSSTSSSSAHLATSAAAAAAANTDNGGQQTQQQQQQQQHRHETASLASSDPESMSMSNAAIAADAQSISRSSFRKQHHHQHQRLLGGAKINNPPIGVRTKAERLQSLKVCSTFSFVF